MNRFEDADTINARVQQSLNGINSMITDAQTKYQFIVSNPTTDVQNKQKSLSDLKVLINGRITTLLNTDNYLITTIPQLNSSIATLKQNIKDIKTQNDKLVKKLHTVDEEMDETDELIDDYRELYNITFLRNWGIFLSILVSLYTLSSIFKSKVVKI